MGRYEARSWPANPDAPGGREERKAIRFRAFIPDAVAAADWSLPSGAIAAISAAERAVDTLNRHPPQLASLEVLARHLLRAESLASSRIEGLVLSQRRLARAEVEAGESRDETARSVLANVAAMEQAVALGAASRPLTLDDVLEVHRILMQASARSGMAGSLRDRQNWLGGNVYNPGRAEFIPPPPEYAKLLCEDLVAFMNRGDLPPVLQAAIAHAQFETIHPFADGNGRVGRALIHVILRRSGLAPRYVPPVSLVLAADVKAYVAGLTAFRDGDRASWIEAFARAVERAARKASDVADRVTALQERWRERAGRPRRDSSTEALITTLPAHPLLTLATAQELVGRSKQAANEALRLLEERSILTEVTLAKRNRAWEARELFDLVNDVERELATPEGADEPARPAPQPWRARGLGVPR